MISTDASILWPSLGHPVTPRHADCSIDVYLRGVASIPDPRRVRASLSPVRAGGDTDTVELQLDSVEPVTGDDGVDAGAWAQWVRKHSAPTHRLRFRVPELSIPEAKRTLSCDLRLWLDGNELRKPGAVFLRRSRPERDCVVAIGTDIHVSTRWDEIARDAARIFPARPPRQAATLAEIAQFDPADVWTRECFEGSFINPNRNLAAFVERMNRLHERGSLDFVVLTGDLVDYKFRGPRGRHSDEFPTTEWALLAGCGKNG